MQRVGMMTGVDSWPMGTAHGRHIMAVTYVQHVRPMPMCGVAAHGHGEGKVTYSPFSRLAHVAWPKGRAVQVRRRDAGSPPRA